MGWKIVGYLLAFILTVSLLITIWNAIGMWLMWGPHTLIGAVALVAMTAALIGHGHARRHWRMLATAEAARTLERRKAALGIPITADQTQPYTVCVCSGGALVRGQRL